MKLTVDKEDILDRCIFGQPEAVTLCRQLIEQAPQTTLREPRGSMLLMGPTGTGKTFLVETAAKILYGEGQFLKLDMARFYTDALIADAFGPNGELSRHKNLLENGCVVLLDEIDKLKDPGALRLFMNPLDNGQLQLTDGNHLEFSNVFIFCTSNLACSTLLDESSNSYEVLANRVAREHQRWMGPEVYARFRAAVVYRPLSYEAQALIATREVDLELENQAKLGNLLFISRENEESILRFFVVKGYEPKLGARPMRNAVRHHIRQATHDYRQKLKIPRQQVIAGGLGVREEDNEKEPYLQVEAP